jgi:hypothetical protein
MVPLAQFAAIGSSREVLALKRHAPSLRSEIKVLSA